MSYFLLPFDLFDQINVTLKLKKTATSIKVEDTVITLPEVQ